jgi:hypothetical protein
MFEKGQKLVFVDDTYINPLVIIPKVGEVVTCDGYDKYWRDSIVLIEYPTAINGKPQSIAALRFRPLQTRKSAIKSLLSNFVEVGEKLDEARINQPETTQTI